MDNKDQDRIDELTENIDNSFDFKAAGYTEKVDGGIWTNGVDIYLEDSELKTKSKRKAKPGDNFYWLAKKSFLFAWFLVVGIFVFGTLFLFWVDYPSPEEYSLVKLVSIIVVFLGTVPTLIVVFGDYRFIPYHFDRKLNRIKYINAELWHTDHECLINPAFWGEVARYFPESMRIKRGRIFMRDLMSPEIPTRKKCMDALYSEKYVIEKEDMVGLFYLYYPFSKKKDKLFKRLVEEDPDLQYEVVYYEKSKVIKEFRPLENKEYSPITLEILELINKMYP